LATFKAHLNGDISAPVAKLLDQAVRLGLLANLSWGEITEAGALIQDGKPHPAIDIYLKVAKQQREVLVLLGLPHRAKDISLQDVLQGRVEHAAP
jgi:hypothetical protein